MSDQLKVLGQVAPGATTEEDLYTAPNLAQVTCSSLVICNRSGATRTFRVAVCPGGVATANQHYLFFDASIDANTTRTVVIGITLAQTDVVRVYASTADLSFSLFGVETIRESEAT